MQEPMPSSVDANRLYLEYFHKVEEEKKCKMDILTKSQFIDWLIIAISSNKKVIYSEKDVVVKEDCINTGRQLKSFFQLLKEYADRNYIVSTLDDEGISYNIECKGTIIKVGFYEDNETVYYARVVRRPVDSFIPFDTLKGESLLYMDISDKRSELLGLYNYVRNLKLSGFTDDDIIETTSKALKYVK